MAPRNTRAAADAYDRIIGRFKDLNATVEAAETPEAAEQVRDAQKPERAQLHSALEVLRETARRNARKR